MLTLPLKLTVRPLATMLFICVHPSRACVCFFTGSHHKLICYRIITYGAIDNGYSHLIVYIECTTNNLATTVNE